MKLSTASIDQRREIGQQQQQQRRASRSRCPASARSTPAGRSAVRARAGCAAAASRACASARGRRRARSRRRWPRRLDALALLRRRRGRLAGANAERSSRRRRRIESGLVVRRSCTATGTRLGARPGRSAGCFRSRGSRGAGTGTRSAAVARRGRAGGIASGRTPIVSGAPGGSGDARSAAATPEQLDDARRRRPAPAAG